MSKKLSARSKRFIIIDFSTQTVSSQTPRPIGIHPTPMEPDNHTPCSVANSTASSAHPVLSLTDMVV